MRRTPEPEIMDDEAQARAYAEADFSQAHDLFVALLHERLPVLAARGVALDLGCGPADVTRRVARSLPDWRIDGIDAAPAMLRHGRAAVARSGLSDRVVLQQGHLPDCDAPRAAYDLVFSNSLLHHLTDPLTLWRSVHRWSRPDTAVFIMDLRRPSSPATAEQLVNRYAAGEPEVLRRDFLNSLYAAYRVDEVRDQLAQMDLRLEVAEVSDRHLAAWGTTTDSIDEAIYHLVVQSEFAALRTATAYTPATFAADGFIHCATRASVLAVADDYFGTIDEPLLLLSIDRRRLTAPLVFEAAAPIAGGGTGHLATTRTFPHLYGPLNLDAVTAVASLHKRDGHFGWPQRWDSLEHPAAPGNRNRKA